MRELQEIEKKKKLEDQKFKNEFKDTMDYLEELNKKKKKKRKKKNKTLKVKQPHTQIDINPMNSNTVIETDIQTKLNVAPDPPYSILKGGTKPTYRQWKKTLKKQMFSKDILNSDNENSKENNITINNNIEEDENLSINNFKFQERKQKLDYIKNKLIFYIQKAII